MKTDWESAESTTVSVITVALNAAETIEECLESISQQDHARREHIVVDGGSEDGTRDILLKHKDRLSRTILEPDDGISDAFNKGIAAATGDYIGILNADDYYEPETLSRICDFAAKNAGPDVIYGSIRYAEGDVSYDETPGLERIWDVMSVYHPAMFVRRDIYDRIGAYSLEYRYAMDSEWVHRALANGVRFARYPGTLATMRLGGTSHRNLLKSLMEFRRSSTKYNGHAARTGYFLARQYLLHTLLKLGWFKRTVLGMRTRPDRSG